MEKIIEVLAWPITTIIVVVLLRGSLSKLITTFKKLKYKDLELEFEREAIQILSEAERDLPEPEKSEQSTQSDEPRILYKLSSDVDPANEILSAWRKFELFLRELGKKYNLESTKSVRALVMSLEKQKVIQSEAVEVILNLAALRNRVAHTDEETITYETSLSFRKALSRVESTLK